jgi:GNAT superfamily N-acetyltransferase
VAWIGRTDDDRIVNGVSAHPGQPEEVIWRSDSDRIVVVTPFSEEAQRVWAQEVCQVAKKEMRYDFQLYHENEPPDERNLHLFLYCQDNRAVGLLLLEKRTNVCHYTWEECDRGGGSKTREERDPVWTLGFVWTCRKHRRSGIATRLIHEATRFVDSALENMGVYTPFSKDGEALARKLFPKGFLSAKE